MAARALEQRLNADISDYAGDPGPLVPPVRKVVWFLCRNLPISAAAAIGRGVYLANAPPRFEMLLLTGVPTMALLLAAVGIYGIISYSVSRRTYEIGTRVSLRAIPADVPRTVIRLEWCPPSQA